MTAGQSAAGRDVESINEEAVEAAAQKLGRYSDRQWAKWKDLPSAVTHKDDARRALAAALPLLRLSDVPGLERQLRDKIAGEIEAEVRGGQDPRTRGALLHAADVVRGLFG